MGGSNSKASSLNSDLKQWQLKQRHNNMNIWRNRSDPSLELQQYPLYMNDSKEFNRQKALFFLRKDSAFLVSSVFFKEEKEQQFCSSIYKGNLFLERTPVRLSNVTEIPYPDILHVHSQALRGFGLLVKECGPFYVDEDNFGITKEGVVKVWVNRDFEKSYPSEAKCTEENMVRNILEKVENNTDSEVWRRYPSILNFIYQRNQNSGVGFVEALGALQQYIRIYNNGQTPEFLGCVRRYGTDTLIQQYYMSNPENKIPQNEPIPNHESAQSINMYAGLQQVPVLSNLSQSPTNQQQYLPIVPTRQATRQITYIEHLQSGRRDSQRHPIMNKAGFYQESNYRPEGISKSQQHIRFVPILQAKLPSSLNREQIHSESKLSQSLQHHQQIIPKENVRTQQINIDRPIPRNINNVVNFGVLRSPKHYQQQQHLQQPQQSHQLHQSHQPHQPHQSHQPHQPHQSHQPHQLQQLYQSHQSHQLHQPHQSHQSYQLHQSHQQLRQHSQHQSQQQGVIFASEYAGGRGQQPKMIVNQSQLVSQGQSHLQNHLHPKISPPPPTPVPHIPTFIQGKHAPQSPHAPYFPSSQPIPIQVQFKTQQAHQHSTRLQDKNIQQTRAIISQNQPIPRQAYPQAQAKGLQQKLPFGFHNIITESTGSPSQPIQIKERSPTHPQHQQSQEPSSDRSPNNTNIPEMSDLSTIRGNGNQVSSLENKKFMSEKPFSEIRGQSSINNSTVNFYNTYMNKEDQESQAEWQDYTTTKINAQNQYQFQNRNQYQIQNQNQYQNQYHHQSLVGGLQPRVVESGTKQKKYDFQDYTAKYQQVSSSVKDGTSSQQFLNQLKSFKKQKQATSVTTQESIFSANNREKRSQNFEYRSYIISPQKQQPQQSYHTNNNNSINNYEATYQQHHRERFNSSANSPSIQNKYTTNSATSYNGQISHQNVTTSTNEATSSSPPSIIQSNNAQLYNLYSSPPKSLQQVSYKVSQSPSSNYNPSENYYPSPAKVQTNQKPEQHQINNHESNSNEIKTFHAESFGMNNPKGKTLDENLEVKQSMVQQEEEQEYQVQWDPEILADLQNIKN